jgi:hypothetical protein
MACGLLKVPYMANVTGLGVIEKKGLLQKLMLTLYKAGCKKAKCVFFQNASNLEFFKKKKVVGENVVLLPGSGVNVDRFSYLEYPEEEKKPEKKSDKYFPKYEGNSVSIVDALIAVGAKWDRVYRGKIANANGINFYVSSAAQNTQMVKLIKAGKLIKP